MHIRCAIRSRDPKSAYIMFHIQKFVQSEHPICGYSISLCYARICIVFRALGRRLDCSATFAGIIRRIESPTRVHRIASSFDSADINPKLFNFVLDCLPVLTSLVIEFALLGKRNSSTIDGKIRITVVGCSTTKSHEMSMQESESGKQLRLTHRFWRNGTEEKSTFEAWR